MTTISVDTSPLQAAREWRGLGLVAAAMSSGLTVSQAEGLESGDPTAFASIDEMIAAAVVYGSTIGIGRDEAMALLDRTVCGGDLRVELPATEPTPTDFSGAVRERSARLAGAEAVVIEQASAEPEELAAHPVLGTVVEESVAHVGPTPEQAVAATGELLLDPDFGPGAPWERGQDASPWSLDPIDDEPSGSMVAHQRAPFGTRALDATYALLERVVGTERADTAVDWMSRTGVRLQDRTRDVRERLRRSEHATLFVAIGGGAVLIALLVGIGGALGGSDDATGPATTRTTTPAVEAPAAATAATDAAKEKPAAAAEKPAATPIVPPRRITLDVFNNGSRKGYAKTVADKLDAAGYRIGEVGNTTVSYGVATVIYPKDMAREARIVARRAGISKLQVAPGSTRTITLIVK